MIDFLDESATRGIEGRKTNLLCCRQNVSCAVFSSATKNIKLECGPMPNLMVALPNIGGALCSTPQSLADAQY